jgi:hypothetical protein
MSLQPRPPFTSLDKADRHLLDSVAGGDSSLGSRVFTDFQNLQLSKLGSPVVLPSPPCPMLQRVVMVVLIIAVSQMVTVAASRIAAAVQHMGLSFRRVFASFQNQSVDFVRLTSARVNPDAISKPVCCKRPLKTPVFSVLLGYDPLESFLSKPITGAPLRA